MPEHVRAHYDAKAAAGAAAEAEWNQLFAHYAEAHPDLAAEFTRRMHGAALPADWKSKLPKYDAKVNASGNFPLSQMLIFTFVENNSSDG